jgi:predicted protein tyrosine phosphatase
LVHCFAGVSRSATIVIAYLMVEYGMTLNDALIHVRKQRYFINPNDGFRRQLQTFQRELNLKRAEGKDVMEEEEKKVLPGFEPTNYGIPGFKNIGSGGGQV